MVALSVKRVFLQVLLEDPKERGIDLYEEMKQLYVMASVTRGSSWHFCLTYTPEKKTWNP